MKNVKRILCLTLILLTLTTMFASSASACTYYSITYSANGGSGAPATQKNIPSGSYVSLSSVQPTRSGYSFMGWSTSSSASTPQYSPGETICIKKSLCLYAVWAKVPGYVQVIHRDKDTGEILRQDTYTLTAGKYGPYYTMSFADYGSGSLAPGSAPASGTVASGQTVVITFQYSKIVRTGTINVVHKDRDTNAVLRQDTYTVNPGAYGPYNASTFSGYGAGSLAAGSAQASGTISAGQTLTITYVYCKTPVTATINVVHKDQDTGAVLRQDTYTVNAGYYGPYNAASFSGYNPGALAAGSAPASGNISAGQTLTITYQYAKTPVTATVKVEHRDQETGALLRQDSYTVNAGYYGPYNASSFSGYQAGVLAWGSSPASGTIGAGQTLTIVYEYRKTPATATVSVVHKDRDTNAILRQDNYTVNAGYYGPYNPSSFTGYNAGTLAAGSAPASGTISAGQTITITYVYAKASAGKATINFLHKDKDTGLMLRQEVYTVDAGPYGPYNAMTFSGYGAGTLAANSAPPSGTISAGQTINVGYLYQKTSVSTPATITVLHKDQDSGAILKQDSYTVNPGAYGPYNATTFSGYGAGTLAANSAPPSGTISAGQSIKIGYLYKKTNVCTTATIAVVHKDQDSGAILRQDSYTVNPGAYGPYNASSFSGYNPGALAWGSSPASGTISAGQSITITYQYSKCNTPQTASITVIHKDKDSGAILKQDTYTVNPGPYAYYGQSFPGYNAATVCPFNSPATGTISAGQNITILFLYTKTQGSATIKVYHKDRETGAILWEDTLTVPAGSYGPYNTYPFPGYGPGSLAAGSAAVAGTINNGETKVITFLYSKTTNECQVDPDPGC